MRFLSVNHLQLGGAPGGVPAHLAVDTRTFSTRIAWQNAVALAQQEDVHAVVLSGGVFSSRNSGLEPWGPLIDGVAELHRAEIPVIAIENGNFTARNLNRIAPDTEIHWLKDSLNWEPRFTTSMEIAEAPAVHVVPGSFAQSSDTPVPNPVTLQELDHPDSIWILTDSCQPDLVHGEHALIVEPGSPAPISRRETGRHGAWLIDTGNSTAELIPLANLEYASIDIDISKAEDLDNLERIITSGLIDEANIARADGSIANTLLTDVVLTGSSRLYPALQDAADELQRMLVLDHNGTSIAISQIAIDATPIIDLEPLLNRPDPVGEVARLIHALSGDDELSEAQSNLVATANQKLLSISHARVFGSILDLEPEIDATTILRRQSWAILDALVRQRGID